MKILDRIKIEKMKREIRLGRNLPPVLISMDGIVIDAIVIEVDPNNLKLSHSSIP